jgi:hypothetical protein
MYFNILTQQLQEPVTGSAQEYRTNKKTRKQNDDDGNTFVYLTTARKSQLQTVAKKTKARYSTAQIIS